GYNLFDNGSLKPMLVKAKNDDFFLEDILMRRGQFAPTASYFFRREVLSFLPEWVNSAPVGDFLIEVYSMKIGKGIKINERMCMRRFNTEGSWTRNILKNLDSRLKLRFKQLEVLNLIQESFQNVKADVFVVRRTGYLNDIEKIY